MVKVFSKDGSGGTNESTGDGAEGAGSFNVLAGAVSWCAYVMVTDRMAPDLRRRHCRNHAALVCEVCCGRKATAVLQQGCRAGVTREEKATLGGSW